MSVIDSRVVNIDDLKGEHFQKGDRFEFDAVKIGPLFFVVNGRGTLRYGDETRTIRAGDLICCPAGGPETAHQIVNDSDAELAYLSVSTIMPMEVCEYPDWKKVGAFGRGLPI